MKKVHVSFISLNFARYKKWKPEKKMNANVKPAWKLIDFGMS